MYLLIHKKKKWYLLTGGTFTTVLFLNWLATDTLPTSFSLSLPLTTSLILLLTLVLSWLCWCWCSCRQHSHSELCCYYTELEHLLNKLSIVGVLILCQNAKSTNFYSSPNTHFHFLHHSSKHTEDCASASVYKHACCNIAETSVVVRDGNSSYSIFSVSGVIQNYHMYQQIQMLHVHM